MKKFFTIYICISMMFVLLSACANNEASATETPLESTKPDITSQEVPGELVTDSDDYPMQLTNMQLIDFKDELGNADNYGFLLSDYDDIRDVNLDQLLYGGAGMSDPSNSKEIKDAYLESIDQKELDTGCIILTSEQIDEFLVDKTGYDLESMNGDFSWDYISQYDAYIVERGDTNKCEISVNDGKEIEQNIYEVEYTLNDGIYAIEEGTISGGTVTFKVVDEKLVFLSNSLNFLPKSFPKIVSPQ